MKTTIALCVFAAALSAQPSSKSPLIATAQATFAIAKNDITRTAEKVPADLWSYKRTADVRTIGQLIAHVADGQYEFCSAAEGRQIDKGIEKNAKTPEEIKSALKEAFAYCDGIFSKMTDASAVEMVSFFNMKATRVGLMDFNTAHTMEHYGNLVTYMRMKGIVPPSSEPRKQGAN